MVQRPSSYPAAREALHDAKQKLADEGKSWPCNNRPVPFTEVSQSPADAARLCGRDLPEGDPDRCPLLELCAAVGFTESVYADNMVYGGYTWRRGLPVVSETDYEHPRRKIRARHYA